MMSDVVQYYDDIAAEYASPSDPYVAKYHNKRFQIAADLLRGLNGRLFDFGCGNSELGRRLGRFTVEGCDISPEMVALANRLYPEAKVRVGGIEYFLAQPGPFEVIACLNVLPYLSEDDEESFYTHARKTAKYVLVSCANALFDLVTFNKYTVEFFRRNMSRYVSPEAMAALPALLTKADFPASGTSRASDRELVNKRAVDPFTYKPEGFAVVAMRPLNFFPLPPVILQSRKDWELAQPDIELTGTLAKLFSSQFQMLLKVTR
jgi:SAM-dependent methyltransferase